MLKNIKIELMGRSVKVDQWFDVSSSADRPGIVVEFSDQLMLPASAIAVTQSVECGSMARLGDVGEFMVDYIVAQFRSQEYVEV